MFCFNKSWIKCAQKIVSTVGTTETPYRFFIAQPELDRTENGEASEDRRQNAAPADRNGAIESDEAEKQTWRGSTESDQEGTEIDETIDPEEHLQEPGHVDNRERAGRSRSHAGQKKHEEQRRRFGDRPTIDQWPIAVGSNAETKP